ncbi:hypothetical protein [Thetidibacter halocola]|uniref:Uncharacterized protein n=1 Tax=Thetidibacter halocola TaxID=2827239 RepID=A0A8J7WJC5_9RHOB|nr:hypothetical protein [Thetidibacter halocola]MBS0126133.1 hypothetical protein [Thetidibacter halocola]
MTDAGLAIKIVLGGAVAVAVISLFPPLTAWTPPERTGPGRDAPQQVVQDNGLGYCRETLPDADCACFARTAGEVLNGGAPRAAGWEYADRWDLARAQATEECS